MAMSKCPGCGSPMIGGACPKCGKNKGGATPKGGAPKGGKPTPPKKK